MGQATGWVVSVAALAILLQELGLWTSWVGWIGFILAVIGAIMAFMGK